MPSPLARRLGGGGRPSVDCSGWGQMFRRGVPCRISSVGGGGVRVAVALGCLLAPTYPTQPRDPPLVWSGLVWEGGPLVVYRHSTPSPPICSGLVLPPGRFGRSQPLGLYRARRTSWSGVTPDLGAHWLAPLLSCGQAHWGREVRAQEGQKGRCVSLKGRYATRGWGGSGTKHTPTNELGINSVPIRMRVPCPGSGRACLLKHLITGTRSKGASGGTSMAGTDGDGGGDSRLGIPKEMESIGHR